jgi:hypothetical protein
MNRWVKQNLGVVVTLLGIVASGIAGAAVLNSDVQRLKEQFASVPERLVRLETKIDYIINKLDK